MSYLRSKVVDQAQAWLGYNEDDETFKEIIDVYNNHKPLARGYTMKYTDEWCATFVSAVAIKCGYTDIMPTECGCEKMIALYENLGCWEEDDSYVPSAGDVIFYDWQDSGSGDNTGHADHVGIVESVSGSTITVIEGNYSSSVKRRTLQVKGKYIRGFGLPKYTNSTITTTTTTITVTEKKATDSAKSYLKSLAGTYVTTDKLNMRNGAGTGKKIMVTIPKGTTVKNYGYYTNYNGTKWLSVQVSIGGVKYTGFCSEKYLKKQ